MRGEWGRREVDIEEVVVVDVQMDGIGINKD